MLRVAMVLCALAGCGGLPPPATPADAMRANIELADLQTGRSLLLSKCGGCHRAPMPSEHSRHDWPAKLEDMVERANVNVQQRRLIEGYLLTMATR